MSKSECIGDAWKDVVSNPGHPQGLPMRPQSIQAESVTIEGKDESITRMSNKVKQATEWITSDVVVNREDWL